MESLAVGPMDYRGSIRETWPVFSSTT